MNEYRVRKARPIAAELRLPGDFALSLRAVLVAALANGPSVITLEGRAGRFSGSL